MRSNQTLPPPTTTLRKRNTEKQEWLLYLVLIGLTLPARLLWMRLSLWLDEAWVANAILAPSFSQMMYYSRWVQSTPALFMIFERAWISLAGAGEITLRVIPWVASLSAAILFCDEARRLFAFPLGLAAVGLFSVNYWAIKYAQEVKQYSTDLFVSTLFVWLICRACAAPLSRKQRWAGIACACLMCYFSLPAIFWLPSAAFALSNAGAKDFDAVNGPYHVLRNNPVRVGTILLLLTAAALVNYRLFVYPNHPEVIARDWDVSYHAYLGSGPLSVSLPRLFRSVSDLLIPRSGAWRMPIWIFIGGMITVGAMRSLWLAHRGNLRGLAIALAGPFPLGAGFAASLIRKYPVLDFPRLILWMLPSCCLLLCYAAEPAVIRMLKRWNLPRARFAVSGSIYTCGILGIVVSSMLMARHVDSYEGNRQLFETIAKSWKAGDCVFVHGGVSEQFELYQRLLRWHPSCVYVGNTDWPCCALGKEERASNPAAQTFQHDIESAVTSLRPSRLWFALPSGAAGGWSAGLKPLLDRVPEILSQSGCRVEQSREYGQLELLAARCR